MLRSEEEARETNCPKTFNNPKGAHNCIGSLCAVWQWHDPEAVDQAGKTWMDVYGATFNKEHERPAEIIRQPVPRRGYCGLVAILGRFS